MNVGSFYGPSSRIRINVNDGVAKETNYYEDLPENQQSEDEIEEGSEENEVTQFSVSISNDNICYEDNYLCVHIY